MEIQNEKWVIMTIDRQHILCDMMGDREMHHVGATEKRRILTYGSKKKAESAFTSHRVYGVHPYELEAVKCVVTIKEIEE